MDFNHECKVQMGVVMTHQCCFLGGNMSMRLKHHEITGIKYKYRQKYKDNKESSGRFLLEVIKDKVSNDREPES